MNKNEAIKLIEGLRTEYLSFSEFESEQRIAIESVMGILIGKYFGGVGEYFRIRIREYK